MADRNKWTSPEMTIPNIAQKLEWDVKTTKDFLNSSGIVLNPYGLDSIVEIIQILDSSETIYRRLTTSHNYVDLARYYDLPYPERKVVRALRKLAKMLQIPDDQLPHHRIADRVGQDFIWGKEFDHIDSKSNIVGIYLFTNLVNGKKYIGQSTNVVVRCQEHFQAAFNPNNKSHFLRLEKAIRKYSPSNFKVEILEKCSRKELNEREHFYIAKYKSCVNGYNIEDEYNHWNQKDEKSGFYKERKIIVQGIVEDLLNTNNDFNEIASKWNVSYCTVYRINTGKSWFDDKIEYPIRKPAISCKKASVPSKEKMCFSHQKKKEQQQNRTCPICGQTKSLDSRMCKKCREEEIKRLSKEQLENKISRVEMIKLLHDHNFSDIGRIFGVSSNTVAKWCRKLDLPDKQKILKSIPKEHWDEIMFNYSSYKHELYKQLDNETELAKRILSLRHKQGLSIHEIHLCLNVPAEKISKIIKECDGGLLSLSSKIIYCTNYDLAFDSITSCYYYLLLEGKVATGHIKRDMTNISRAARNGTAYADLLFDFPHISTIHDLLQLPYDVLHVAETGSMFDIKSQFQLNE